METRSMESSVDQLNSFLRGELSAVESYEMAIDKFDKSAHRSTLTECMRSHEERARMLESEVRRLGGEPAEGSGAWGTFAKLTGGAASMFGEKSAIGALEEGEDHGLHDFKRGLDKLDPEVRKLVETKLMPEQQRTHDTVSELKHSME